MRKSSFLLLSLLTATLSAVAQPHTPAPVTPAAKGTLPVLSLPDRTVPDGLIPGLSVGFVGINVKYIFNNRLYYDYVTGLSFTTSAADLGGDYFTLEFREKSDVEWPWTTGTGDNGDEIQFEQNPPTNIWPPCKVTEFRVKLHGGAKDGFVSNTVTVEQPNPECVAEFAYSGSDGWEIYTLAGKEINPGYYGVRTYDITSTWYTPGGEYGNGETPEVFCYQWFRRNPYTYELKPIEGATSLTYTPTHQDIGYELLLKVSGDDKNYSFTDWRSGFANNSIVSIPVQAAPSYFGPDGFILNTDYAIPQLGTRLMLEKWVYDEEAQQGHIEWEPAGEDKVEELMPGQYAVYLSSEEYMDAVIGLREGDGCVMVFAYDQSYYDEDGNLVPSYWLRECQLMSMAYQRPLNIKVQADGTPAETTIDIIGRNIHGEWVVKNSIAVSTADTDGVTIEQGPEGLSTLCDGYYVKARATAAFMDTYFPSAQIWNEGTLVMPEMDENWNARSITIDLVPTPVLPLGTGSIEGSVQTLVPAKAHGRHAAAAETDSYYVYLRQGEKGIVAVTTTDAAGHYHFSGLPLGTYDVLVNADGYEQKQVAGVPLTDAAPAALGIDYVLEDGVILAAGNATGIGSPVPDGEAEALYTLEGLRLKGKATHPGIYIRGGRKAIIR